MKWKNIAPDGAPPVRVVDSTFLMEIIRNRLAKGKITSAGFVKAEDFLNDSHLAADYVTNRMGDAAKLMSELQWRPLWNTMQAHVYGHSVVWVIGGLYEILPKDESEPIRFLTLDQVLAYILAKNW